MRLLHAGNADDGEDLLRKYPLATDEEIREGFSGNLCRCTGYQNIVAAIRRAAAMRTGESAMKLNFCPPAGFA